MLFVVLIIVLFLTQVVYPILFDLPLFYWFRKEYKEKRQAEDDLEKAEVERNTSKMRKERFEKSIKEYK